MCERLSWKPRKWLVKGCKDRYGDKPFHEVLGSIRLKLSKTVWQALYIPDIV
ncbi:MAG: hypothetical protein QXO30_02390 [Candidatus Caldarchaeum sp.]